MTSRASFILCWFYALYSSLVAFAEMNIIPASDRTFYLVTKFLLVWMVVPAGFALRKNPKSQWANWAVGFSMMVYPGFCGYWRINYEYAVFELLIAYALAFAVTRTMFIVVAMGSATLFSVTRIMRFEYLKPQFTSPAPTDGALIAFAIATICLIFYLFVNRQRVFRTTALMRFGLIGQHASNIIHDVKNLISTPSVHAATLKRKLETNTDPEVHEIIDELQTSLSRTHKLVVDLNEMARLTESGHITVISLRDLVREVNDFLYIHMRGVVVEVHGDLEIKADRALLYSVLMSLFMNSVDQFRKSATEKPMIHVHLEKSGCRILDNGGGFDSDALSSLKNEGWSRTTKSQGSGMGLYLVTHALNELGGAASFSNTTNGASVELRFAN